MGTGRPSERFPLMRHCDTFRKLASPIVKEFVNSQFRSKGTRTGVYQSPQSFASKRGRLSTGRIGERSHDAGIYL
jgi:hypothetical protein